MTYKPAWDRLLASLRTWADAREVAGGIEVSFVDPRGARRTAEIVMTPENWEELSQVIGAETEDSIKEQILALEEDEHFVVCDSALIHR